MINVQYIPGHLKVLHGFDSAFLPRHGLPPRIGSIHSLVRSSLPPPHDAEHEDHSDQSEK